MTREAGMGQVKVQRSVDGRNRCTDERTQAQCLGRIAKHSWVTRATPIQQLDNVCDG